MYNRSLRSYYTWDALFRKQNYTSVQQSVENQSEPNESSALLKSDVPSEEGHVEQLKRSLSVWDLIAYGLASTLGTGIFVTVGEVAKNNAGPGIIFSFLFAGFASFLSALCYSEFAARIPVSGSAYSFAYIALGEVVGWFVGWNLTLEYAISASAVAGGWTGYFVQALKGVGVHVPVWLSGYYVNSWITISPLSAMIVLLCTGVLLFGMKESARFNMVVTAVNLVVILFFIILGAFYVEPSHWDPFLPFGMDGTWRGVGVVFFSYIGFDAVSTLAGEVKKPSRDLPVGIVGTLGVVTLLYMAVGLVLTGIVHYTNLDPNAPLAAALDHIGLGWAGTIVSFGSVTTITCTTLASLVGQPRIFYQMASDGLMFKMFGKLNKKTGVPVEGTIITGILSAVIALFFDLNTLVNMISIGTLLAFTVVCGGVVILRYQSNDPSDPNSRRVPWLVMAFFIACVLFAFRNKMHFDIPLGWNIVTWVVFALPMIGFFVCFLFLPVVSLPKSFKCPLVPWVPCLGILMNVWFIVSLPLDSIYRLLVWTFIGMAIYFGYGIRHSKLAGPTVVEQENLIASTNYS